MGPLDDRVDHWSMLVHGEGGVDRPRAQRGREGALVDGSLVHDLEHLVAGHQETKLTVFDQRKKWHTDRILLAQRQELWNNLQRHQHNVVQLN